MRFADIIAELKRRFQADLERFDVEWQEPKDADTAKLIEWLKSDAPPAPRDEKYLIDDDVERWITETGFSSEELFNSIAMYLARGFYAGTLPFGFCDAIVNGLNLFTLIRDSAYARHAKNGPSHGPTKLFWDVFLAFDAGEFFPNNDRSKDPIDTYTRPQLAKILEENLGFRYPDDSV